MKLLHWMTVLAVPLFLAACATGPKEDPYLSELQQRYDQLAATEQARLAAPTELLNAEEALQTAAETGDEDEKEHQLYLARQYLALADTAAQRRSVETRLQALAEEQRRQRLQQAEQRSERLASELAALETKQTDRGYLVTLKDVFFETERAQLQPGAGSTLEKLAEYMQENPDQEMIIEGHTDSRGPSEYNQSLSQQRAQSVKSALVSRGISADRIATRGYGEDKPIASNTTSGGRQLNRRVEIVLPQGS